MSHAEKCPICGGTGKLTNPNFNQSNAAIDACCYTTCHGCAGVGWITVQDYEGSAWMKGLESSHDE